MSAIAKNVIGIDVSQATAEYASKTWRRERLRFQVGSAAAVPIEHNGVFDVIPSFEAIEDLDEPE